MKFYQIATITAVSGILLSQGITGFAEEAENVQAKNVTTEGTIYFIPNDDNSELIPPITEPDVDVDPVDPETAGPLAIVHAPTLDFGKQKISAEDKTYYMNAEMEKVNNDNTNKQVP